MSNFSTFIKIFKFREKALIEGAGKRNLVIVAILFFVTFFAIAYALQGITDLRKSMDNPFTNWVDMEISYDQRDLINGMKDDFVKKQNLMNSFHLKELMGYSMVYHKFYQSGTNSFKEFYGRTIDLNEQLCNAVLSSKNDAQILVPKEQWTECGIIVTSKMLEDLGVERNKNSTEVLLKLSISAELNQKELSMSNGFREVVFWTPVLAVVNSLPQNAEFLLTATLKNLLVLGFNDTKFVQLESNVINFLTTDSYMPEKYSKLIESFGSERFEQEEALSMYGKKFFQNTFYLNKSVGLSDLDSLLPKELNKSGNLIGLAVKTECVSDPQFAQLEAPQYLAFYFSDLNKVRLLKQTLKEEYQLELDMSAVEDKDNFSKVSMLTSITTIILFIIGLGCLSLFTWFFLKNHLEQSRKNLGTLTAFGLGADTIAEIYVKLINTFMIKAFLIGLLIIVAIIVMTYTFSGKMIAKVHDPLFGLAIVITFTINLVIAKKSIYSILKNTPGNLIYGRT